MPTNRVKILGAAVAYCVHVQNGVADIRPEAGRTSAEPALCIELEPAVWGEIVLGLTSLAEAHRSGRLEACGDLRDLAKLSEALLTGLEPSEEAPTH